MGTYTAKLKDWTDCISYVDSGMQLVCVQCLIRCMLRAVTDLCCCVASVSLQDPSDKRFALCDETLEKLTGEKRIQLFGGQKYFKEHILKD